MKNHPRFSSNYSSDNIKSRLVIYVQILMHKTITVKREYKKKYLKP